MGSKTKKKFSVSDSYTFTAKLAEGDNTNTWCVRCKDESHLSCTVTKDPHEQIDLEIRSKEELLQVLIEIKDICELKQAKAWHQLTFTNTTGKSITLTFANLPELDAVYKHISQWQYEYVPNCAYFVNFQ